MSWHRRTMPRCMKPAALAAMSLLLAGCAGLQQSTAELAMFYRDYAGPAAGRPTALMRLSADGVIRVTPDSGCADFLKPDTGVALFSMPSTKDYSHLHNRKLGVKGDAPPGITSTEIALEAGKPAVISFTRNWTHRGTGYLCQVHRSLTPEAGAQYQLLAEPVLAEGRCTFVVARVSEPAALVPTAEAKLCGR